MGQRKETKARVVVGTVSSLVLMKQRELLKVEKQREARLR